MLGRDADEFSHFSLLKRQPNVRPLAISLHLTRRNEAFENSPESGPRRTTGELPQRVELLAQLSAMDLMHFPSEILVRLQAFQKLLRGNALHHGANERYGAHWRHFSGDGGRDAEQIAAPAQPYDALPAFGLSPKQLH